MSFYQNPIKYCNMTIYCNTLKHNMQYGIDLYCFTTSTYYSNISLLSMGTYYPQLTSVQYHTIQLVGIIDGIKFDESAQSKKCNF